MTPIILWVALCMNNQCTDATVYAFKAHSAVTQGSDCKQTKYKTDRLLLQNQPYGFKTVCKTAAEFDRTGFDDGVRIDRPVGKPKTLFP